MTNFERHEEANWCITFALALWLLCLSGCASPKAIRDAEAAANRSTEAYAANMDALARAVADAYRREATAHVEYLYRAGLDQATGPDGKLAREIVETANKDREAAREKVDAEYQRVVVALAKARLDLEDARLLRKEIEAYLAQEGVDAETITATLPVLMEKIHGVR